MKVSVGCRVKTDQNTHLPNGASLDKKAGKSVYRHTIDGVRKTGLPLNYRDRLNPLAVGREFAIT